MDIHGYLRILRRSWILVVATTLAGLLVGAAASILVRPMFTSETQLFVALQNSGSVQDLQQGNTFSQARVQSYVKTVTTPVVLQPVIDSLDLPVTADQLADKVKASADLNTVLINISVTAESPDQAAAIAKATANSLIRAVDTLEKPKNGSPSPFNLSVVRPAEAPSQPSSPNTRLNLILGLIVGLAVGIGVAILRAAIDTRVRGEADLRSVTDASLLGGIAEDTDVSKHPLLTQIDPQSPRAESFRQLRTNLQFANVSGKARSILVTSSIPSEGKTTTATNLAIAIAQTGQTVCLVDADLRRPKVNEYLGLERNAGLTTALIGEADVNDLLQKWGTDELYVLTSGRIPPNPSELLGSQQMKDLIRGLESVFDTVIIDAPPVLPVTDAAVVSQYVGGVLVVVNTELIKQQVLLKSLSDLELVGANIFGVVLNRLPTKGPDTYSYTYQNYAATHDEDDGAPHLASVSPSHSGRQFEDASTGNARLDFEFDEVLLQPGDPAPQNFPAHRIRERS